MAMRMVLALLLGFVLAANGLWMLIDPAFWYAQIPGVPETGPLNPHFVRDIGCAYLLTGGALIGHALDERPQTAAFAGALFLTLHALVHVADAIAGRGHVNAMSRSRRRVCAGRAGAVAYPPLTYKRMENDNVEMADQAADR